MLGSGIKNVQHPQCSQRTCTLLPPGPETSSPAAGLGSPGGGGRSAGPAPLSPPPGPTGAPAKTGSQTGKGSVLKKKKKRYERIVTVKYVW